MVMLAANPDEVETTAPALPNVALVGYMRSGKDSVASYLIDALDYRKVSFAGAVKEEVADALNTTRLHDEGMYSAAFFDDDANRARFRPLLQWWGTEYRRGSDPDYWVRRVEAHVSVGGPYVATDARFTNELDMLKANGFVIIELAMIERELRTYLIENGMTDAEVTKQLLHATEHEWQDYPKDFSLPSSFGNLVALTADVVGTIWSESVTHEQESDIARFFHDRYPERY